MAYTFQVFVFKSVLTSAQMNQVEVNVRDHVHGTAGVVAVPDAGLSSNVALKNINNAFSVTQNVNPDLAIGITTAPNELLEVGGVIGSRVVFSDGQGANRKGILFESPGTTHPTYGKITVFNYGASLGLDLLLSSSGGNVGVGVNTSPTAQLHVTGTGLFTGDLTVKKTTPRLILDTIAGGDPILEFRGDGVSRGSIEARAFEEINLVDTSSVTKITFDTTTGTMSLGGIPDARLTTNVVLKDINNSFSIDQTISSGAFSNLLIDATGAGGAEVKFLKSGVTQSRVAANALDAITLKDGNDNAKVNWDLSGTNGKLTQGDVPLARLGLNDSFTTGSLAADGLESVFITHNLGTDDVIVLVKIKANTNAHSAYGISIDANNFRTFFSAGNFGGSGNPAFGGGAAPAGQVEFILKNTHSTTASTITIEYSILRRV